ncbi:MAG: hypothetical protein QOK35_152 [Pseudonocardiales bacterium]|jgi:hypothetical protein|nr:hypothetical protein [Pseudonocardiales bacterium]
MTADVTTPRDGARPSAAPEPALPEPAQPGSAQLDPAPIDTTPFRADPAWTAATALRRLSAPAALASVGLYVAAGGHLIAALVHLSHGWRITAFFLVVAAVQVVAAGRVARGAGSTLLSAVLATTLGLVLLYLASRTMTLPFGGVHTVHNDRPQDPDLSGTLVVAAELLTLATGPAMLPATVRRWATNAMLLVGVGLWAAWGTGLL